jgi:hypothetical protein
MQEGATAIENRLDFALNKCIAARARGIEKAKAIKTPVKSAVKARVS